MYIISIGGLFGVIWKKGLYSHIHCQATTISISCCSLVFEHRWNIPVTSRGYLIAGDFTSQIGRKPSSEEYTSINDFVRKDIPLPQTPVFEKLQEGPRNILGVPYDPQTQSYAEGLRNCYWKMGQESIRIVEEAVEADHSIHVYPQGLYSTRLTKGRIGALQIAQTGLPIV